MAPAAEKCAAR